MVASPGADEPTGQPARKRNTEPWAVVVVVKSRSRSVNPDPPKAGGVHWTQLMHPWQHPAE